MVGASGLDRSKKPPPGCPGEGAHELRPNSLGRSGIFAGHQVDAAGGGAVQFDEGRSLVHGEDRGGVDFLGGGADRHLAAGDHERNGVARCQREAEVGVERDRARSGIDRGDDAVGNLPVPLQRGILTF